MSFVELAAVRLKEHGHRMTQSRHQILMLFDSSEKVLTAEDIQQDSADKKLDSATVYRILQVLEELHIVKKIHIAGGYYKYPLESENVLWWQFCIDQKTRRVVVLPLTSIDTQRQESLPWFSPHQISCEVLGDFGSWTMNNKKDGAIEQEETIQKKFVEPSPIDQETEQEKDKKADEEKNSMENSIDSKEQKTLQVEPEAQKDPLQSIAGEQISKKDTENKEVEERQSQKTLLTKKLRDF